MTDSAMRRAYIIAMNNFNVVNFDFYMDYKTDTWMAYGTSNEWGDI